MQILNSAVKTFLKCQSDEAYDILNQVFEFTENEAENPDLRERGFIYWRLMSIDPNAASHIVLSEKPRISEDASGYESSLLEKLVNNLGTLSTIYGKPPESFVKKTKKINYGEEEEETENEENAIQINETDVSYSEPSKEDVQISTTTEYAESKNLEDKREINLIDLDDIVGGPSANQYRKSTNMEMSSIFDTNHETDLLSGGVSTMKMGKEAIIPRQVNDFFKLGCFKGKHSRLRKYE